VATDAQRLAEEHRKAQALLIAALVREMVALWPAFSATDVAASWPGLRRALVTLIRARHRTSSGLAATYYQKIRQESLAPRGRLSDGRPAPTRLAPTRITPVLAPDIAEELIEGALTLAGPVSFKESITRGKTPEQARSRALVTTSGAATRLVLDGGRTTTVNTVRADKAAAGWARLSDGDPCSWCSMLISRGPSYKSAQSAGAGEQWHAHCGCTPVPVYKDVPWAGEDEYRKYRDLWYASKEDAEDGDLLNAFRRAYESQQKASAP
jgi:hypothetical protein